MSNPSSYPPLYTNQHPTASNPLSSTILTPNSNAPILLRLPTPSDIPALVAILSNPANTADDLSVATMSPSEREALARKWLTVAEPPTNINFVVELVGDDNDDDDDDGGGGDRVCGIAGLGWIGDAQPAAAHETASAASPPAAAPQAGAVGVVLNPEVRGRGLAVAALEMVIDFGLRELRLVEVRLGTTSRNVAMVGLMERRLGMPRTVDPKGVDRFGNDLIWRIGWDAWGEYLGRRGGGGKGGVEGKGEGV